MDVYEKFKYELVFYKYRTGDAEWVYKLAPYCFVEIAKNCKYLSPLPMNIRISLESGDGLGLAKTLITGIHVMDDNVPFPDKHYVQKFGDV